MTTTTFPKFNPKLWSSLVAFMNAQQHNTASPSIEKLSSKLNYLNCWIIDSGASNHMTWEFKCLFDIKNIAPSLVTLLMES